MRGGVTPRALFLGELAAVQNVPKNSSLFSARIQIVQVATVTTCMPCAPSSFDSSERQETSIVQSY